MREKCERYARLGLTRREIEHRNSMEISCSSPRLTGQLFTHTAAAACRHGWLTFCPFFLCLSLQNWTSQRNAWWKWGRIKRWYTIRATRRHHPTSKAFLRLIDWLINNIQCVAVVNRSIDRLIDWWIEWLIDWIVHVHSCRFFFTDSRHRLLVKTASFLVLNWITFHNKPLCSDGEVDWEIFLPYIVSSIVRFMNQSIDWLGILYLFSPLLPMILPFFT